MLNIYTAGTAPAGNLNVVSIFFSSALYICIVMIERYYYLEMDAIQVNQMMKSSRYELEALNLKVENEQRIRSIYHDMKNHYIAIDALLESGRIDEARNYMSTLSNAAQSQKTSVGTGNPILDQLLSEKLLAAQKEDIPFKIDLDYSLCGFISNVDTVIIFANILDNAIEAASRVDKDRRFIRIKGGCSAGCFLCVVSNSCTGELRFIYGLPATTKKDALNHGYGIKNIQKALSSYNGELNVSADEPGIFSLYITIPLVEKE